ncbi:hypothetical protein KM043_010110 [Ampulex compressa]|nr:hypothetical protein KM043_010110 [Ampulex compressa]
MDAPYFIYERTYPFKPPALHCDARGQEDGGAIVSRGAQVERYVRKEDRRDLARRYASATSGSYFPVRESGSSTRMSAKISLAGRAAAQSTVNHRGKPSSGLLLAGTSVKRPLSLTVEVGAAEGRAVKRAAVTELEASTARSSARSETVDRDSRMPALTRACTTASLPRIKRFRFQPIRAGCCCSRRKGEPVRPIGKASTSGSRLDITAADVKQQQQQHQQQDQQRAPMSTLVCCEPVSAGRSRDNLKLVLNRSLSEPGPPASTGSFLSSPTSPVSPSSSTSSSVDSCITDVSSIADSCSTSSTSNVSACSSGLSSGTDSDHVGDVHRHYHHHHHHHHHHLHHCHQLHPLAVSKRCKLETVSLPASPCSETGSLQRQLVLQRTRTISAVELGHRLLAQQCSPVILDCRPFILYNVNHVRGAINVNCSDRFNRRRLQLGKATLADLATAREGKEILRRRHYREVVVYDDCTDDLERLPAQHPLFLVLAALVEDNREPALLLGE